MNISISMNAHLTLAGKNYARHTKQGFSTLLSVALVEYLDKNAQDVPMVKTFVDAFKEDIENYNKRLSEIEKRNYDKELARVSKKKKKPLGYNPIKLPNGKIYFEPIWVLPEKTQEMKEDVQQQERCDGELSSNDSSEDQWIPADR